MDESDPPIKVLSVVGAGRSGTTVLASILSEVDGFGSVGELRWLWQRGVLERRPCGCGEAPDKCPVWSRVLDATLTTAPPERREEASKIVASQRRLAKPRNRWRVLRSARGGDDDWEALVRVRSAMGAACSAYSRVTGSRVIVDTSKRPFDAAVMASLPHIEHYVLHVVRDPRAVAHSWRRSKTFSVAGEARTMGTRRLPATVRRWWASGLGAELLRREVPSSRWLRMRYEDFCVSPREHVDNILSLLGEPGPSPFEAADRVVLHHNHIVAGNPSRFTVGAVKIELDDAWRSEMRTRDQHLVELATAPLMRRYGYRLRH